MIRFKMLVPRGPLLDQQASRALMEELLMADALDFRKLVGLRVDLETGPVTDAATSNAVA